MASVPDPDNSGTGYGFSRKDADRIARSVRTIERQIKSRPAQRGRFPVGTGGGIVDVLIAKCGGSGIPARATAVNGFEQPGRAQVTLLFDDGTYLYVPVFSITLGSPGSGYADGTGYALSVTGGGSPITAAAGTFDVVGGVVSKIIMTTGGKYLPGLAVPTIGFPGAGGSGASATSAFPATVECVNFASTAVGNNHYISVALCSDGYYRALSEDC